MEQQEKQLLLKDLCARLPYGVICHTEKGDGYLCSINQTIFGTEYGLNINPLKRDYFNDSETDEKAVKPYLRPMSSMSRDESFELGEIMLDLGSSNVMTNVIDFYNAHHLDHHNLIKKGLALEAPEDMYKQ